MREADPPGKRWLRWAIVAAILAVYAGYAFHLRWTSEDAYISFRYARNLIEGHGLVFNIGERVEGYSNFLWLMLVALGMSFGVGPETFTTVAGLASSVVTFFCVLRLHRRIAGEGAVFPAALLTLALSYTWASFSTSGLETSLLCACLYAGLLALTEALSGGISRERGWMFLAGAGVAVALAAMTRADAILVLPAALACLFLDKPGWRRVLGRAVAVTAPIAAIGVPYFVWRTVYYGDLLPNTFYAKSAGLAYYGQGVTYLLEFTRRYFLWLLAPWPLVAAWLAARDRRRPDPLLLMMVVFVAIHTLYVVRVGGDFMEGRFFVPFLPCLYLVVEWSLRRVFRPPVLRGAALAVLVLTTAVNHEVIEPGKVRMGITDERSWREVVRLWYREGTVFGERLPPGTWIATDAVGAFGYASGLPIVDTLGLTDRTVAREPLRRRSQPGHEKRASRDYLRARDVALLRDGLDAYRFPRPPDFEFAGNRYFLLSGDPGVVEGFRRAAVDLSTLSR